MNGMSKRIKVKAIYKIENKDNGKFYIGSALDVHNRFAVHRKELNKNKHHNPHLQAAWNKYGKENFKFEILLVISEEDNVLEWEQLYLDILTPYDKYIGYNKRKITGSSFGFRFSEETKKKQSSSAIARFRKNPVPKGEDSPISKLTWGQIYEMRRKYATGNYSRDQLGKEYKIDGRYISSIMSGEVWVDGIITIKPPYLSDEDFKIAEEMYKQNISWNKISIKLGKGYRSLRRELIKRGIIK